MVARLDALFAEVDRQLEEVTKRADGFATRSGILISVEAVAATVFAASLGKIKGGEVTTFVLFGLSVAIAFASLLTNTSIGPTPAKLAAWVNLASATTAITSLYDAKVTTLEASITRLAIMRWAFYLEVVTVLGAVASALVVTARR